MIVAIEELKKHLNIDPTFSDDDNYIASLEEVSVDAISVHLNRALREEAEIPSAIIHAIKLMVGQLYAHREPTTSNAVNTIPYTLDYLISLYRNYK